MPKLTKWEQERKDNTEAMAEMYKRATASHAAIIAETNVNLKNIKMGKKYSPIIDNLYDTKKITLKQRDKLASLVFDKDWDKLEKEVEKYSKKEESESPKPKKDPKKEMKSLIKKIEGTMKETKSINIDEGHVVELIKQLEEKVKPIKNKTFKEDYKKLMKRIKTNDITYNEVTQEFKEIVKDLDSAEQVRKVNESVKRPEKEEKSEAQLKKEYEEHIKEQHAIEECKKLYHVITKELNQEITENKSDYIKRNKRLEGIVGEVDKYKPPSGRGLTKSEKEILDYINNF